MVETLKKIALHSLTEQDNSTFDVFRVFFVLAMLIFFGLTAYSVWKLGTFAMQDFANAFAVLFGSGATGTAVKSKLEGPAKEKE